MPELYLRGSIANITMANLKPHEKEHISEIFEIVSNHPEMIRHKAKVMKELGVTIRGDYAEDRSAAEQEFQIAVWRGCVNIFYHRNYTFKCMHCESSTYLTQRGKPKPFERIQTPCPNCRMAIVDNPGCSDFQPGECVNHDDIQNMFKHIPNNTPTFKSTITYIEGDYKYKNAEEIINCPKQLKRFFGEFVWNYFRQQIKENKRKEDKKPIQISGPADEMIVEEIISLCTRLKIWYSIDTSKQKTYIPSGGKYTIKLYGLLTPPEFSIELAAISQTAREYGIIIDIDHNQIEVFVHPNPPTIAVTVIKPEHISVIDNQLTTSDDGESTGFTVNQISYRTLGAERMDLENHVFSTDMNEASTRTRGSLPDGNCKYIYDIYCQIGPLYERFSEEYGDGIPKINHVAAFLGITPRAVKQFRETIKIHCLANDFTPELV